MPDNPSKPNKTIDLDKTRIEKTKNQVKLVKVDKLKEYKQYDLVQTGTDINFLIPIGAILMLIGAGILFKKKEKQVKS